MYAAIHLQYCLLIHCEVLFTCCNSVNEGSFSYFLAQVKFLADSLSLTHARAHAHNSSFLITSSSSVNLDQKANAGFNKRDIQRNCNAVFLE